VADRAGFVQAADGGTLLLDEVGELAPGVQAALLRFLESGEVHPVGAAHARRADVRLIAATHRDLRDEVRAGRFRRDLFYRLHVVPLELPPLRERGADVELLARRLTADLAARHRLPPPSFTRAALRHMRRHPWPGNVRELRNLCERLVILRRGATVEPEHLALDLEHDPQSAPAFRLPADGILLDSLELDMIRQALERTGGNRSQAARLLGISRDTLLYRMRKHGIDPGPSLAGTGPTAVDPQPA
jgi:DNA-binding NtrC family response regulator